MYVSLSYIVITGAWLGRCEIVGKGNICAHYIQLALGSEMMQSM